MSILNLSLYFIPLSRKQTYHTLYPNLKVSIRETTVLKRKTVFGIFKNNKKEIIQKYLKEDAQLLDVRTASEFNNGHIEGSKNIPFNAIDQKIDGLDKNKPVIVYCAMGGRSNIAASKLKSKGFKVVNAVGIGSMRKYLKP